MVSPGETATVSMAPGPGMAMGMAPMTGMGMAPGPSMGPVPMLTETPQSCAAVSTYSVGASSPMNHTIKLSSSVVHW